LRWLVAQGAFLGFDDDGADGVAGGPGDDDGVGFEVGRRAVVEGASLGADRQPDLAIPPSGIQR
jgi:hypothetical protein